VLGHNASFREQLAPGIDHWRKRMSGEFAITYDGLQGITVGDVNGDGLSDLYACQPGGLPNRLFVQHRDGTATDRSAESGTDWLEESEGALLVDLDNDGDQDLVIATRAGMAIMANDGAGNFVRKDWKQSEPEQTSLAAADYDNDGDLDIYVCSYRHTTFDYKTGRWPQPPTPYHDANNGGRNVLWRNDGDFQFTDATAAAGLDQNNRRFSFAAVWEDFDNDGDLDIYVANDFGRNNLYRHEGGRFQDVAAEWGVEDISAGMSVASGDYDNDGWMDIYVSNMFSSAGNRIAYQRRFHSDTANDTRQQFQRHARGNSLFQNRGPDGSGFADVSVEEGVTMGRWAWASLFNDINNDGLQDLLVANGFVTGDDTSDL